jgi:putative membrane protein
MIVTFLAIAFDNPGRFLAMLLLVLQLGASGGTFPIQTSPGFFQAINPFLPMTYSILALLTSNHYTGRSINYTDHINASKMVEELLFSIMV